MLQDKSEDFEDTWMFLDRRFQEVRNMSNMKLSVRYAKHDSLRLFNFASF
jgi:hypothetical protein